jgi:hypothetical protein
MIAHISNVSRFTFRIAGRSVMLAGVILPAAISPAAISPPVISLGKVPLRGGA